MSEESKHSYINERPLNNKYCIMTTIHMLKVSKQSYTAALKRHEKHLKGLTDKYYNVVGTDISSEDREEIVDLHEKIHKCEDIIENIDKAITIINHAASKSL